MFVFTIFAYFFKILELVRTYQLKSKDVYSLDLPTEQNGCLDIASKITVICKSFG